MSEMESAAISPELCGVKKKFNRLLNNYFISVQIY